MFNDSKDINNIFALNKNLKQQKKSQSKLGFLVSNNGIKMDLVI